MTEDFNIRDSNWNPSYPHYSASSNTLLEIADSLDLKLSFSINQVSTWYIDNLNNANLVIDLMFLQLDSEEIDNHLIL